MTPVSRVSLRVHRASAVGLGREPARSAATRTHPILLCLALGLATACGEPAPAAARWIDLSEGYQPPALLERAARLEAALGAEPRARLSSGAGEDEVWFELALPRESWTRESNASPRMDVWSTARPQGGALVAAEGSFQLLDRGRALSAGRPRPERPGWFWQDATRIYQSLAPGAEPSTGLTYRARLEQGRRVGETWRVAQGDLVCNGILLFPGQPETLSVDLAPDCTLSFATVAPPGESGPTRWRVHLGERLLLDHVQEPTRPVRSSWHRLELEAVGRHELRFELEGPAPAVLATPALGPRDRTPPAAATPDLVLILCDTFRADNLAAFGGKSELAPKLNRFVAGSLRFLEARSTAAWTLPSIGSILAGVFPGQHGGTDLDRKVVAPAETVAELLARAGWRTAAVTDSGFFSRHYGQDQGFQWFEEVSGADWNLAGTLARARAQRLAGDGRPLFLVVHTYRVHGPMRVGPEEDPRPYQELAQRIRQRFEERKRAGEKTSLVEVALEFGPEGLAIYENAVGDLDAKVGAWLEELEREGFFERGRVVLTADHGNSHGEHRQIGHGSDLYDVKLRVPLALFGRGLEPRAVSEPVSLIDLAPTLAELAGVPPSPSWVGRSLLGPAQAKPLFAFDLKRNQPRVAVISGDRKAMANGIEAFRDASLTHVFELSEDPTEDRNLVGEAVWPMELCRSFSGALETFSVPLGDQGTLELPPEVLEQLRAIGYGD